MSTSFLALLSEKALNDIDSIWNDILLLPVAFAAFSSIWLILRSIFLSTPVKKLCKRLFGSPEEELDEADEVSHQSHISALGGWQIFAFRILRLEGCLVLLGLSLATFIKNEGTEVGTEELWIKLANVTSYSKSDWLQLSMCITYVSLFLITSRLDLTCFNRHTHLYWHYYRSWQNRDWQERLPAISSFFSSS
jgi:hypothetical protein